MKENKTSVLTLPAGSDNGSPAKLEKKYDRNFQVTTDYRESLPDLQNSGSSNIEGANVPILQVGISNFKLPLAIACEGGGKITLETSITGSVSLSADEKGINMSRIMRTFYKFKDRVFTPELLEEILLQYKTDLGSTRARLRLDFSYPMLKKSLRSGLEGYQYYQVAFEGSINDLDQFSKRIHFDFVYSSACPCSSDLSEHARENRNIYAIPHSQRSKARVSVEVKKGSFLSVESMQKLCLEALRTETQVLVKREDEQAFAELNGAYVKFVEDAARLLYEQFDAESRIIDFQIACAHLESLHSHDAIAVINKGRKDGFNGSVDDFRALIC